MTPRTYCTSFLSVRQYVEEQYGAGSFKRLRDELLAKHQVELPMVITPGSWLPTEHFVQSLATARDLWGPQDLPERFGRRAAEYEMRWVHRVILRFTSPVWLLEQGAKLWDRSHNTGRLEIEGHVRMIRGRVYDFAGSGSVYCPSLVGWLTRACQMTGAEKVKVVETDCRGRGAKYCQFEGFW
jgi:hypothetical protein